MLTSVNARIGKWLSAALDDPNVCDEMKIDIRAWFDAAQSKQRFIVETSPERFLELQVVPLPEWAQLIESVGIPTTIALYDGDGFVVWPEPERRQTVFQLIALSQQ